MDYLPDELVCAIFAHLTEIEKCSVARVCKRWKTLAYLPCSRWCNLSLRPIDAAALAGAPAPSYTLPVSFLQLTRMISDRFAGLETLTFHETSDRVAKCVPGPWIKGLSVLLPKLKTLRILGCFMDDYSFLKSLKCNCKQLQYLEIPVLNAANLVQLAGLPISELRVRLFDLDSAGVSSIPAALPSLRRLFPGRLQQLSNLPGVLTAFATAPFDVCSLVISDSVPYAWGNAATEALLRISSKNTLRELQLNRTWIESEDFLVAVVTNCSHTLTTLRLPVDASDLTLEAMARSLSFPLLETLSLTHVIGALGDGDVSRDQARDRFSWDKLVAVIKTLPALRDLELYCWDADLWALSNSNSNSNSNSKIPPSGPSTDYLRELCVGHVGQLHTIRVHVVPSAPPPKDWAERVTSSICRRIRDTDFAVEQRRHCWVLQRPVAARS